MGQYFLLANCDRREFLSPWAFGDGAKYAEFGCSERGVLSGLAALLLNGNGQGGGDLEGDHPVIGSWAGDRVVIAGDYGEPGRFIEGATGPELLAVAREAFTEGHQEADRVNLYFWARAHYRDVSLDVIDALCADPWLREALRERLASELPGNEWGRDCTLPKKTVRKLLAEGGPRRPLQVLLAEAVLRAPTDPVAWQGLVLYLVDEVMGGRPAAKKVTPDARPPELATALAGPPGGTPPLPGKKLRIRKGNAVTYTLPNGHEGGGLVHGFGWHGGRRIVDLGAAWCYRDEVLTVETGYRLPERKENET